MKALYLVIIMSISSTLFAQKISVGSEVGLISSKNKHYNLSELDNRRQSFYVGLNVNYALNERFELSSGLHYLRQGYKHSTCYMFEDGANEEVVGKLDYLIVPLTLNTNFGKAKRILTTIGIYGGLNIKAAQDYEEPIGGCDVHYPRDISNVTRDVIVGGIFGLGYKIYESEKIELKSLVKYYQGLNNSMKNPYGDDDFWKNKYSSVLISLSCNYKI